MKKMVRVREWDGGDVRNDDDNNGNGDNDNVCDVILVN